MTTLQADAPIEIAGRRLNPGVLSEWQDLLTHFELSEGFSFIVLLVPDADWAQAARIALVNYLDAERKSLLAVDFSDAEDFKTQLPGRLLNLHTNETTGAVWVEATVSEASPQYQTWLEAWRGMSARLNQFRNPLSRQLNVPLIFAGAHWIQPAIRDIAPDLWSVRTMVTRLEPPVEPGFVTESAAAPPPTEQELEGRAIDPDFALKAAERLRGQSGKELGFAQLLYRAGLGLLARSRWAEAESALREALDLLRKLKASPERVADSLKALGSSLEWQYRFDDATKCVDEARVLFAEIGDVLREANCIKSLGNIALQRSDHSTAKARYEEALPLYRRAGNVSGEANCIFSLGEIAKERSDYATAKARYEGALLLYRRNGNVLGEANCIIALGEIALRSSDDATANARCEEALPLFRRVGNVLGEANCIKHLGTIALRRSDHATAKARYEEALALFRRVREVLGEANCIQSLGTIALLENRPAEAREKFVESLHLYQRIADPYSAGCSHILLARLAPVPAERDEHLAAAREDWTKIDRPDLIEGIENEFNTMGDTDGTNS